MRFPLKQALAVAGYIRRQKRKKTDKFPLVLMLEPLHACNLSCSGCGRIREYKDYMSEMLSLDDCIKAAVDCEAPVISICGGEPLLYPQIGELTSKLLDMGRVVYLCTNGQALEQKLHLFKPHGMLNFNVHIDAMEETHDIIVGKPGAFKKAIDGIKAAKKAGFTVCTNTTVYNQTDTSEVRSLVKYLTNIGVDGFLISPGFDYSDVEDQSVFLTRDAIIEKFRQMDDVVRGKKVWNTNLFYDFLQGKRDYPCTPWGNVTYNIVGWKAPCYLITDKHFKSYPDFINNTEWDKYGPERDPRCKNCMAHCGFEASVALQASSSIADGLKMAAWTFF